jgi:hypothetical protein
MGRGSGHFCVVWKSVTLENLSEESCSFHHHVGWKELNEYHLDGSLQPVDGVREHAKDENGREPDYILEWLIPGRVLRYKKELPIRGMSSKYGTYLADALSKRKLWARVFLADMRRGNPPPADEILFL